MPRFLITRPLPGAGKLSTDDHQALSAKSNEVVAELAPNVHWVLSYVVADKIYCIYNAKDADTVREHARRAGFPLDTVERVQAQIDPITGEA